ncbi:hypothetical protein OU995_10250 [Roseateles sp. SL47]|uniref:hypothetical protein n=1 Tax=Roseateles sp. SL47 TaxID=2995138 RepID=UPI00226DE4D6|nr:hypothetical protein [Roseateles sp. SL47]WAC75046.1 hypothetical protein OU995_10250 [Roseateles sp. SL47]
MGLHIGLRTGLHIGLCLQIGPATRADGRRGPRPASTTLNAHAGTVRCASAAG